MRLRRRRPLRRTRLDGPVALRGRLWCGDGDEWPDGVVVVDATGAVVAAGPSAATWVAHGAREIAAAWVGPGLYDAHVHLAFGTPEHIVAHGVVAVRDLGAPPADAARWRRLEAPHVEVAGPILTAPGGYPSRSWGSAGFAAFVDDPEQATRLVAGLAGQVDVVKLALEPAGGAVPSAEVCAAVVEAAHAADRPVTAHALGVATVELALDAGVDELAHTPTEPLPRELVARIASAGVAVVSTLQTFVRGGAGRAAVDNATALAAAGVRIRYGTDLGNDGTRSGADPAELTLLADAVGLGAEGALRAATRPIAVGQVAGLVALDADPRLDPTAWRRPAAVMVGRTLLSAAPAGAP